MFTLLFYLMFFPIILTFEVIGGIFRGIIGIFKLIGFIDIIKQESELRHRAQEICNKQHKEYEKRTGKHMSKRSIIWKRFSIGLRRAYITEKSVANSVPPVNTMRFANRMKQ